MLPRSHSVRLNAHIRRSTVHGCGRALRSASFLPILSTIFLFIIIIGQTTYQTALAMGPAVSTGYSSFISGSSSFTDKNNLPSNGNIDVAQFSQCINEGISTSDSSGIVKINTSQPVLAFTHAPLLEGGCGGHSKTGFITPTNYFNLDSGNILISSENDLTIGTEEGVVSIGSGATIFVMESRTDMIIYDLYQTKPKQVSVIVNNHKLVMEPGCMLVITKEKTRNFENLSANCHSVRYRKAQEIDLQESTVNAFVANFSIMSALVRIQPLKQLVDSKDKRDQLLLQKLLKSAAMLRT